MDFYFLKNNRPNLYKYICIEAYNDINIIIKKYMYNESSLKVVFNIKNDINIILDNIIKKYFFKNTLFLINIIPDKKLFFNEPYINIVSMNDITNEFIIDIFLYGNKKYTKELTNNILNIFK